jgi:hypothetical protein
MVTINETYELELPVALPPALLLLLPADAVAEASEPGRVIDIVNDPSPALTILTTRHQAEMLRRAVSAGHKQTESLLAVAMDVCGLAVLRNEAR